MLTAMALGALIMGCAPDVSPDTMNAIVQVESGGNPLAIHDNTTMRAYAPRDQNQAIAIAHILLNRKDSIDVGIAQINSVNFAAYHVNVEQMLTPCANLHVASQILHTAYDHAFATTPTPEAALWGAVSAYNTGSIFAGRTYVAAVVAQAQRVLTVPTISLLLPSGQVRRATQARQRTPVYVHHATPVAADPANAPIVVHLVHAPMSRTLDGLNGRGM